MIHIAVCDDDPSVIERIECYFERLHAQLFDYDVFYSGTELFEYRIKQEFDYDIYFLDIEMEEMNGLELAKKLREADSRALIIFLTGYPQYVFDVFEVVTFDFILKPMTFEQLQRALEKAFSYLKIAKMNFVFSYRKSSFSIPCEEIQYIDKAGRKAFIHTKEKSYQCNMTLEDIWKQLDKKFFAAIHTSCIVNLSYTIEIVRDELLLRTNQKLYVSRSHLHEVKMKHLQFMKDKL